MLHSERTKGGRGGPETAIPIRNHHSSFWNAPFIPSNLLWNAENSFLPGPSPASFVNFTSESRYLAPNPAPKPHPMPTPTPQPPPAPIPNNPMGAPPNPQPTPNPQPAPNPARRAVSDAGRVEGSSSSRSVERTESDASADERIESHRERRVRTSPSRRTDPEDRTP